MGYASGKLFFYGFADARMLWLLVGATIVFYSLGVGIANAGNDKTKMC